MRTVHSMTAFARAQTGIDSLMLTWELRSVNHRFLEAHFRLPEQLRSLEHGLKETLRKHLKRGKVDCTLRLERSDGNDNIELNRPLLLQILAVLEQIRRDAPEVGAPNVMDLLRWPGVIGDNASLDDEPLAAHINDLFEAALAELIAHRNREGTQLNNTIAHRLDDIDRIVGEVKSLTASVSHEIQAKLEHSSRNAPMSPKNSTG